MLAECVQNTNSTSLRDYNLVPGDQHIVCAMFVVPPESVLYCLDSEKLLHVPAELLRVIDCRISRHWRFSHDHFPERRINSFYWGFEEFALDESFREALFEYEEAALLIYRKRRELLNLEFRLPRITKKVTRLEGQWIMCSKCGGSWQEESSWNEMVRCPQCNLIQLWS